MPKQSWYKIVVVVVVVLFNRYIMGDKKVHIFPKEFSPKVNLIALLEFKLAAWG